MPPLGGGAVAGAGESRRSGSGGLGGAPEQAGNVAATAPEKRRSRAADRFEDVLAIEV
jgi:hypothetical protein